MRTMGDVMGEGYITPQAALEVERIRNGLARYKNRIAKTRPWVDGCYLANTGSASMALSEAIDSLDNLLDDYEAAGSGE